MLITAAGVLSMFCEGEASTTIKPINSGQEQVMAQV